MDIRAYAGLALLGLMATACAVQAPRADVERVELRGLGLLEQSLTVGLCISNPNDRELAFRRVSVAMDVAGFPLAEATSEAPVRLPSRSSTSVPFAVATTSRNLGSQAVGIINAGGVDYRLHGSVQLDGALGLTLPFNRSGRLDLLRTFPALLADTAATPVGAPSGCARSPGRLLP